LETLPEQLELITRAIHQIYCRSGLSYPRSRHFLPRLAIFQ